MPKRIRTIKHPAAKLQSLKDKHVLTDWCRGRRGEAKDTRNSKVFGPRSRKWGKDGDGDNSKFQLLKRCPKRAEYNETLEVKMEHGV